MAAAPVMLAMLSMACGRSLLLDARSDGGGGGAGGAGGAPTSPHDGGNSTGAGGASGAAGSLGTGGAHMPSVDAGIDRPPPPPDASHDVVDAHVPDVAADHTPPPDASGCLVDCTKLPHVLPGATIPCVNGVCVLSYENCQNGYSHCSATPNVGCETALAASPNCGACGATCYAGSTCRNVNGYNYCLQPCLAPTPDACGFGCVDLQSDPTNCGTCNNNCYSFGTRVACQQGRCAALDCNDTAFADCTGDPSCETQLGDATNCGGCNDPACTLTNTMFTCSDGLGCNASVCEVGAANCDTGSPDCETSIASSTVTANGGCLPLYVGTIGLATQMLEVAPAAIAPDGSFFLGGSYQGMVDFDPSPGTDVRTANDLDGFITKFNADGSYAWTATLDGRGSLSVQALAVTPSGGIVATGSYNDVVDLDPSGAQDVHVTSDPSSNDPYVVELAADGSEVWGRTFASTSPDSTAGSAGISVDAAGGVYVVGSFFGTVDFDPAGSGDVHTSDSAALNTGFLVKLTSAGAHAWSQTIDDSGCSSQLQAVAVGADGSAWATGLVVPATTCALTPGTGPYGNVLVIKIDVAGDTRSTWTIGESQSLGGTAMTVGRDGAIYIGGVGAGATDMDPGPGVARRWLGSQNGFVLKLAADGTYQWARSLTAATQITSMAPAPDGGVIASGSASGEFVARLTASGAPVWTMPVGDGLVRITSIASNQTSFVIGGASSEQQDFDPGPAMDDFDGDLSFVSRFEL